MRFYPTKLLSQLRFTRQRVSSPRLYTVSTLNTEQEINHLKIGNIDLDLSKSNQFTVQQVLHSTKDNPTLALSFLKKLKRHGISLNINGYKTVVRILTRWRLDRKLDSLLVELIQNEQRGFSVLDLILALGENGEKELLVKLSTALVKAYASLQMFDEAIDVLIQSNRFNCFPSIKAYNFLMNRMIEFGEYDTVISLFHQRKHLGLTANAYTYAIVIKALCRKGDLEQASKLLEETPSVFGYTTFIEGLCLNQQTKLAADLINNLIDEKILSSVDERVTVYGMVVRGFCNEMNIEAAEEVIFEMERTGIGPDVYACSVIIHRHCKNLNLDRATEFLDAMLMKGLKVNCVIVSYILHCCVKMKKYSKAIEKFEEFKEMNVYLDKVCYNVAIDALCKLGKMEKAIKLFKEMTEKGMSPDVRHYTTIVNGYCLQGKVADAHDWVDEMRENGISPDVITYNVLLSGCARFGFTEELYKIYKGMKRDGLKPSVVTNNVIILGLCLAGRVEEAVAFFNSLEEKDEENYASLIKGFCESDLSKKAFRLFFTQDFRFRKNVYFELFISLCREGCLDKALVVLKRMRGDGVEPGMRMYGKMICFVCGFSNARVTQLLYDMIVVERGRDIDLFTCTVMIHTYCRLNEIEKAEELFEEMKKRGVKPDLVTYTVLLDAYLKYSKLYYEEHYDTAEGFKRKAFQVLEELERDVGVEKDFVYYTVLIDSQCKFDKAKGALDLFGRMMESGVEPDYVTFHALISGLCKEGYIDKAVRVVTELTTEDLSFTECTVT